jgi:hypothetical protein
VWAHKAARLFAATAAVAATATGATAATARHHRPVATRPTAAQIRAAIGRAMRSSDLWATVNVCNTTRHKNKIGIRAQMPSLGFASRLYIDVRVDYWSPADNRFEPTQADSGPISLGRATHAVHQGGSLFTFAPPAGVLRGVVTFEWRLGGKVIGRAVRKTGHGYKHVDFADPPGYSAGTCTIN